MKTLRRIFAILCIISFIAMFPLLYWLIHQPDWVIGFFALFDAVIMLLSYLLYLITFALRHHNIFIFKAQKQ